MVSQKVSFRLDSRLYDALQGLVERDNKSISDIMTTAVHDFLFPEFASTAETSSVLQELQQSFTDLEEKLEDIESRLENFEERLQCIEDFEKRIEDLEETIEKT